MTSLLPAAGRGRARRCAHRPRAPRAGVQRGKAAVPEPTLHPRKGGCRTLMRQRGRRDPSSRQQETRPRRAFRRRPRIRALNAELGDFARQTRQPRRSGCRLSASANESSRHLRPVPRRNAAEAHFYTEAKRGSASSAAPCCPCACGRPLAARASYFSGTSTTVGSHSPSTFRSTLSTTYAAPRSRACFISRS